MSKIFAGDRRLEGDDGLNVCLSVVGKDFQIFPQNHDHQMRRSGESVPHFPTRSKHIASRDPEIEDLETRRLERPILSPATPFS